jgi:GeoRSP system PqqD family protein
MSLDAAAIVQKISAQASRVTRGQALVVQIEQRKLHRLNAVGTRVWELCDGRSLGAIVDIVVVEFEVEREVAFKDVCAFVEELAELGALTVSESMA